MKASDLTWQEYRLIVPKTIVLLPFGSTEQHGPHLPLNVDVVISTNLASLVADQVEGVVLPPITFGCKPLGTSGCGQLFPGTTSLNGTTLSALTLDILSETYRHGCRRFLLLNGHWENTPFLLEAVDLMRNASQGAEVMVVCWWDMVSQDVIDVVFAGAGFEGWDKEHAAITETSLMLHFASERVQVDKILDDQSARHPPYMFFPQPNDMVPPSGVCYKATYASKEKGEIIADQVVDSIVRAVKSEFAEFWKT
jgi:creatinine amidohydrolase